MTSANSRTTALRPSGMSLMSKRNRLGPRTEPCETPDSTDTVSDTPDTPSMTTVWDRPVRKD